MIRARVLVASFVIFVALGLVPREPLSAQGPPSGTPRLVVLLAVDQMRADYLERYSERFTGGFRRLMRDGAWFDQARYPYLNTITCAGHSTIGTGTFPYRHGMVLNEWFDRTAGKSVECTSDPNAREVSYDGQTGPSDSALRVLVPSLAEQVRAGGGRVVTLSLKARSAIGMAGHSADLVLWFEDRGTWATSSAYNATFDPDVKAFIDGNPVTADAGKTWDRTFDASAYKYSDEGEGERAPTGWTRSFPHPLGGSPEKPGASFFSLWQRSPFADEYLGRLAAALVDAKQLGSGGRVDFLGVSFSSLDLLGHAFGPNSHEVQDLLVRLDRTLGALLDHLDAKVGRGNYVVALTGDHGVAEIPEQVGTGRQTGREVGAAIDKALEPFFGPGKYMAFSGYTDIYFASGVWDRLKENPKAMQAAIDAIRALPGTASVYRNEEISDPAVRNDPDPARRAAAFSYYPGRSGDLILVPKEKWILSSAATTHGTNYAYDQRVPVMFMGAGVKAGRHQDPASPADVAPTLAAVAGIRMAPTDGAPLRAALAQPAVTR